MPAFFEKLQQATRYYGQGLPEFLRTHPVTASRISDTRGRAETYPYKQYPDSLAYQLTKAKIRVISESNPIEAHKYFQSKLNQGTLEQRTVAQYGLGLVALNTQKYQEAESIFQTLAKNYPNQVQYGAALARTAIESRQFDVGLNRYKKLLEKYPNRDSLKLEYIEALLKAGNPEQARNQLASLDSNIQHLPVYYQLLAQVYADLHQTAEYHRYLAEYYYSTGKTQQAILQIRLAKSIKGLNPQLAAILSDRLEFFTHREREREAAR